MKWLVLTLTVAHSVAAFADTYPDPSLERRASTKDTRNATDWPVELQGTWVCVWDQRNGRVDHVQIGTLFVFDGDELTHKFPNRKSSRWKYRVHPDSAPMGIDWTRVQPRGGSEEKGIFWSDGDTLVFCDGFPLDKRPDHFSDASHLNVLRRLDLKRTGASEVDRQKEEAPDQQLRLGKGNAWIDTFDFVVSAKRNQEDPVATNVAFQEGEVFILHPELEDRWGAHGPDGPLADYRGLGRTDSLLTLHFRVGTVTAPVTGGRPITVIRPGILELYCKDDEPWNNVGKVRVKLMRLKTNK